MPAAFQPSAVERNVEVALLQAFFGVEGGIPSPAIPHDPGPAAILTLRDVALEIEVLHRVIFGAHRQPLLADDQARAPRHRPALERAAELEPQIVVHPPGIVLLHDELPAVALAAFRLAAFRLGLGRAPEIALARVIRERVPARSRL